MTKFLEPYSECIHDTVRIVAGYCFILHGLMKFGLLGGEQVAIASLLGLAAIIETVGGALIIVGLFTKPVAFIASGQMAVAYFIGHVAVQGSPLLPLVNRGESAVLFCFLFLYLASVGPGAWSIDAKLAKS